MASPQQIKTTLTDILNIKHPVLLAGMNVARYCEPSDAASIAEAVRWFYDHREEARVMGREGRERILLDWNYEAQFAPVLEIARGSNSRGFRAN